MLYSILSSAAQIRLPKLPSLQYSTIPSSGIQTPVRSRTGKSSGESSNSTSGATTPDAKYKDALALRVFTEPSTLILQQKDANYPASTHGNELALDNSGIEWKYAHQGLNLLSLAVNECTTINVRSANASFARQLYLHALTYMIRGLPQDLSLEERMSIRSALPVDIVEPMQVQVNHSSAFVASTPQTEPSLLHRTLASSIVQLFVLFQFVLPYFTYFLATAYQFDRDHKILQRGFAQGMEALDKVGKSSFALGSVLLEMGDGRVGQLVAEATKWVVEGVAGGIQEGVGEVIMIVSTGKGQDLARK